MPASSEMNISLRLCQFLQWALVNGSWRGGDLDGGSIQEKALDLGLVVKRPATQADCDAGHTEYLEPGDDYFELIPEVRAALGII